MNNTDKFPHIYKKGKILNFKSLTDGSEGKRYYFGGGKLRVDSILAHCNNLNQIVGRNWLGINKMLSYFGIAKDPSEYLSKNPSNFNKFFTNLREGEKNLDKELKEVKNLLKENSNRLKNLEETIGKLSKMEELPINRKEVLDLISDSIEIRTHLRQMMGKED